MKQIIQIADRNISRILAETNSTTNGKILNDSNLSAPTQKKL